MVPTVRTTAVETNDELTLMQFASQGAMIAAVIEPFINAFAEAGSPGFFRTEYFPSS